MASGLTPLERGRLIHEVFETFYAECRAKESDTTAEQDTPQPHAHDGHPDGERQRDDDTRHASPERLHEDARLRLHCFTILYGPLGARTAPPSRRR